MIHKQRFLTNEEWEKYDQIIASVKDLTEGFLPNEICAKPFISPLLINPSVMIVGYNPGGKGTNAKVWNDPHDPSKYRWAIGELLNPKARFLTLFRRCFLIDDWNELVQPNQIDIVWTNLYPFRTPELKNLKDLFDDIRKKGHHPYSVCRNTMARLINELIHPRIVICAGKDIARELYLGFEKIKGQDNNIQPLSEPIKGVRYCQIGDTHFIGFSRITSAGFWYDHRNHNRRQEEFLQSLTHKILNLY